jgi:hypothetical protein
MDDKCEFKKYFMKGLFLFLSQMGGLASKHLKSYKKGKKIISMVLKIQNFMLSSNQLKCFKKIQ